MKHLPWETCKKNLIPFESALSVGFLCNPVFLQKTTITTKCNKTVHGPQQIVL